MRIAVLLMIGLGAGGLSVSQANEACLSSSAARLAEYRSASPLVPISPKNTLRVSVLADGCVLTHLPAYFVHSGLDAERLSKAGLADFRTQLAETQLEQMDVTAVKARHQAASKRSDAGREYYVTADENIIEIDVFPELAPSRLDAAKHIRWGSLHGDLLNHPDDPDLIRLAAVEEMFRAFITSRSAKREVIR